MSETSELLQEPVGNTEFLLQKARAGSNSAWRAILRRYKRMLEGHMRALIRGISRADRDDLLQTVLAKVWVHIAAFHYQGEGSFRRWLARLVINECKNELKARQAGRAVVPTAPRELSEREDRAGAEREELSAELRGLFEHLGELDEQDRDLLVMRYWERMSLEAIAEVLGCSVEKARGACELAFRRLSRRLGA